jgi:hypothetical protein
MEVGVNSSIAQFLVFAVAGAVAQAASAAEPANSINIGIGGLNPMPHCDALIYTLEYEHQYSPTIAILGRGSTVDYTSDDTDYLEDGRLQGVDLGVRYYRAGRRRGFYTGASLGYWKGDRTFTQYRNTPSQREGAADSRSLRVNIDLGYRFPMRDSNVSIMPEVNIGKFFFSSSCDYTAPASVVGAACDQKSEVNYYIFAGLSVGVGF